MGVIYKLKPEIIDLILNRAKDHPELGCRKLCMMVCQEHKLDVSKSSVNALLKQAGLSQPIGRRRIHKRRIKDVLAAKTERSEIAIMQEQQAVADIPPVLQETEKKEIASLPVAASEAIKANDTPKEVFPETELVVRKTTELVVPIDITPAEPAKPVKKAEPAAVTVPETPSPDSLKPEEKPEPPVEAPPIVIAKIPEPPVEQAPFPPTEVSAPPVEAPKIAVVKSPESPVVEQVAASASAEPEPPVETPGIPAQGLEPPFVEAPKPPPAGIPVIEVHQPVPVAAPIPVFKPRPMEDIYAEEKVKEPAFALVQEPCNSSRAAFSGLWFLKCADLCIGGISSLTELLSPLFPELSGADISAANTAFILSGLIGADYPFGIGQGLKDALSVVCSKVYTSTSLAAYLQMTDKLNEQTRRNIITRLNADSCEISSVRFVLEDSTCFFIDPRRHTIWPNFSIPPNFHQPIRQAREWVQDYLTGKPLVLQAHPGVDTAGRAFFNFLKCGLDKQGKNLLQVELYGADNRMLEKLNYASGNKKLFIMGLWPAQLQRLGKKGFSDSGKSFTFSPALENFQVAEGQVFLKPQQSNEESFALRTVFLSQNGKETAGLITNIPESLFSSFEIANAYLDKWPNLDEGLQDFTNKVELSIYESSFISQKKPPFNESIVSNEAFLRAVLANWGNKLNEYCKDYYFPASCKSSDLSALKTSFYNIEGEINVQSGLFVLNLYVQSGTGNVDNLIYACKRLNEDRLFNTEKLRIWLKPNLR